MAGVSVAAALPQSFGDVRRLIGCGFTQGAFKMTNGALPLVAWLLAVAALGTIANFALVWWLFRDTKCRGCGIAVGVFACFALHLPLMWTLMELVIRIGRVPLDRVETLGYYVGPAVFAFISLPVGGIACRCWSCRGSRPS